MADLYKNTGLPLYSPATHLLRFCSMPGSYKRSITTKKEEAKVYSRKGFITPSVPFAERWFISMKERKNWTKKIVVVVIAIVCAAVYFLVPSVNSAMNRVFGMFASGDFDVVRDFVASYGVYAAAVSFLLMIFQSIAAPLPA